MRIEIMIYIYSIICGSMILFNTACIVGLKRQETKLNSRKTRFKRMVIKFLSASSPSHSACKKHKKYVSRKLRRTGCLLAFDQMLEDLCREKPEETARYLKSMHGVFLYLALEFRRKNEVKAAFLNYLICKYKLVEKNGMDAILDILFQQLDSDSLYCRENALQAIYASGDVRSVMKALHILDRKASFHHSKLISDGLLHFNGDLQALCHTIWQEYDSFSGQMRVTLLNFMRFAGDYNAGRFLAVLESRRAADEERFAAIRFFGKYYHEEAYPLLIRYAKSRELRWEYPAIASTALALYHTDEAVEALKENLYSPDWYIRYNASESLERLGITYSDLAEVFAGNDRYAKEIMQYRLENRKAFKEKKGETKCQTVCSVSSG